MQIIAAMDCIYKRGGDVMDYVKLQFPRKEGADCKKGDETRDNTA